MLGWEKTFPTACKLLLNTSGDYQPLASTDSVDYLITRSIAHLSLFTQKEKKESCDHRV